MAILTVSREFGSGGREIGQAVAKVLNYTYIDKERLLADMRASGKEWEEWGKILMSTARPYGKNMTGHSGDSLPCFRVLSCIMR